MEEVDFKPPAPVPVLSGKRSAELTPRFENAVVAYTPVVWAVVVLSACANDPSMPPAHEFEPPEIGCDEPARPAPLAHSVNPHSWSLSGPLTDST